MNADIYERLAKLEKIVAAGWYGTPQTTVGTVTVSGAAEVRILDYRAKKTPIAVTRDGSVMTITVTDPA